MKKLLKTKSILHKKKTKKVSKKVSKKARKKVHIKSRIQIGGEVESLTISYNERIINTNDLLPNTFDTTQPQIIINNSDMNKTYLITMTDPDAPNGIENKLGNFTFTHWVFTQINGKINETFLSYSPPSPPKGTHRYIFNLYDVSMIDNNELNILHYNNNNNAKYYETTLQPFLDKKNIIINPLLPSFQFRVQAD